MGDGQPYAFDRPPVAKAEAVPGLSVSTDTAVTSDITTESDAVLPVMKPFTAYLSHSWNSFVITAPRLLVTFVYTCHKHTHATQDNFGENEFREHTTTEKKVCFRISNLINKPEKP